METFSGSFASGSALGIRQESHVCTVDELFPPNKLPLSLAKLSDVRNITFYPLGGWKMVLTLSNPASLYFEGVLGIKCLAGNVEIDGFLLGADYPDPIHAYSLSTQSALYISAASEDEVELDETVVHQLKSLDIYNEFMRDRDENNSLPTAIVLLWRCELSVVSNLTIKSLLLHNRQSFDSPSCFLAAEEFLNCIFDIPTGNRISEKLNYIQKWRDFVEGLLYCTGNLVAYYVHLKLIVIKYI